MCTKEIKSPPFENVIVLMLENRSFDNLLGHLYSGKAPNGKAFEGLYDTHFENLVPEWFAKDQRVCVTVTDDYHQPFPDPGEEYPHINTQLFNTLDDDN